MANKLLMFLGTETIDWKPADFDAPISFCIMMGIGGLLVKVFDGMQGAWYGGNFGAIYQRITAAGLYCVPYGFHYGYGRGSDLKGEAAQGLSYLKTYGAYCANMEGSWDGQLSWAQELATIMTGHSGTFMISTWANIADHGWTNLVKILDADNVTNVWMPEIYSNDLGVRAIQQWPLTWGHIQPTLRVSDVDGPNNPASNVSVFSASDRSLWEYGEALAQPDLTRQIVDAVKGSGMVVLPSYPLVNQRTYITADGHPSENEDFGCVYSSLLAAMFYFKPALRAFLDPDVMKDAVLGQLYTGGTSITDFIPYAESYGATVSRFIGSHDQQIAEAHRQLKLGNPTIFTQFDDYDSDPNMTHVCGFMGEVAGGLQAHDPFGPRDGSEFSGHIVTFSDATWSSRLRAGDCWTVSVPGGKSVQLYTEQSQGFGNLFSVQGTGWLCKHYNVTLHGAILAFYQTLSLNGGLPIAGLPVTNENYITLPNGKQVVIVVCERLAICYDPAHVKDNPEGQGAACYAMHLTDGDLLKLIPGLQAALPPQIMTDIVAVGDAFAALEVALARSNDAATVFSTSVNTLRHDVGV